MDMSHNFRFRWNDHVPHLSQIFSELRYDEVYCDTTLVSDDGFILKVHGAVLSATSRYFERVLSDVTTDQHPIIVLKGANFMELSCLIDYIYQGVTQTTENVSCACARSSASDGDEYRYFGFEKNSSASSFSDVPTVEMHVDQHLMESVLDVADMLEIKGLSKMKNNLSIKKLIAPSPAPSIVSRNSPLCSSPSKSPTPPSQNSQSQSLSCPSSPNDSYATSVMLKIDTEDIDIDESSQKNKHSLQDTSRTSMNNSRMIENNQDYEVNLLKQPSCSNSEYLDQTLGIDLSLSRATNDDTERASGKNFSMYEDALLKKRKIMKKAEELNPSFTDLEWEKVTEKVDEVVPYKKKKLYTRSVSHTKSSPSCSQDESHKSTSCVALEKLASILSRDKGETKSLVEYQSLSSSTSLPKHKLKSLLCDRSEEDSVVDTALNSQLEVLCSDGALTISVTTDTTQQAPLKNLNVLNGAHVSLSLKKGKKRYRNGREINYVKKECVEDKSFSKSILKRPNTRFYKRLKSYTIQSESHSSESLSVHCDLPFPPDDLGNATSSTKDKPTPFSLNTEEDRQEREKENSPKHDNGSNFSNHSRQLSKESEEKKRKLSCISPLTLFTLPPVKERGKQTRTSLTLEEKIKVIEAFLDGKSQRQIANLYRIGKTQVNGIVKKREEILSLYRESVVRGEKLTMKRQRKSEYASLNEHLIKWYRHMTVVAGMKITTGMLRAKALQIAPQLGYHDFKASNGWLATFKANNNLKFSKAKKTSEPYSNENYDESETQKEGEFFDEDIEENVDMSTSNNAQNSGSAASAGEGVNIHSVGLHLGPMRLDTDSEVVPSVQPPPVSNLSIGNSLLSSTGPLSKPPQMSNMTLGSNIAYNLTREHPRSDLTHLSDLHSASTVNAPPSLAHPGHPTLPKPPEGPLSYKTEDTLSYGYDTQGRMNEGATRGTEYNYTHYGFPSTYYGYHFLGQY